MLKVILIRGLAASGKTTLCNKIKNDNPTYYTWSKDVLFDDFLLKGVEWNLANKKVYEHLFDLIKTEKQMDRVLVVDAPYRKKKDHEKLITFCKHLDVSIKSVLVTCSDEEEWRARFKQRSLDPQPNQTITDYDDMKGLYGSMHIEPAIGEFVFDSCGDIEVQYKKL